ncbi:glycosyltransferase family 32 protein [Dothistroma septosporum NZE10]|uniref:Glycosyltransferase family 32 protein n=1 Tax=Dothistroma septosporum (strain NZE10 / CBS 128990) TaxID=675120 RepID=N1PKD6_DOTSN|nr:glycosyltransferase family 32 protein [Dothistroma septosporum NZE10]
MGRTTSRGAAEKLKLMSPTRKEGLQFGVPKQLQRVLLPACAALLFLFFLTAGNWGAATEGVKKALHKRPVHFPRKVWQTWKVDPMRFEERDHNTAQTWIIKNPDYRYEVLTDQNDLAYVETHFGPEGLNRPDIVFMYKELTARIIKADLLRYMIMYVEGGIYTDIDVEALKPANHFIPQRWNEKDVDMVIGVEIDQPEFKDHPVLGSKSMSFCQWTFMTKPRLPVMLALIENIMLWLRGVAQEQNKPISQIELDFDQVISGTGPSAFTKAILADMSKNSGRTISWDEFHDLNESKLVGGVLVLTVEAFAAGQGHSDSGTHEGRQALVRHHYHASGWPTAHPRFNHPMFGEVERCNWVLECVQAWDANTATWEHMTPEDKMSQLATARTNAEAAQKAAEDAYREAEAKGEEAPPPPPPPGAPGAPPLAEFLNMEP